MATITGLTADRMLEIEAASVVDGDIIDGHLILTKHDGSTLDAGSVIGPPGPEGPLGSDLDVLVRQSILDIGIPGQIRAGRQLSVDDFSNLGLSPPVGLWNFSSDFTDASGNGHTLNPKVTPIWNRGIEGLDNTAIQYDGTTVLYIGDTGTADPFRLKTGTFGAWVRTAMQGAHQSIITKRGVATQMGYYLKIHANNMATFGFTANGSTALEIFGLSKICDDRWHFVVGTYDGILQNLFVDGILEASALHGAGSAELIFASNAPFNIGGYGATLANAGSEVCCGRIDEAFVTSEVLSEDKLFNLYCAKIPHTLGEVPSGVSLNIIPGEKGASLISGDFPTAPLRLYNFSGGSLANEGSDGGSLGVVGTPASVAGVDGTKDNAYNFNGAQRFTATDAGLPSGSTQRSYGCWFKCSNSTAGALYIMNWGTTNGTNDTRAYIANGNLMLGDGAGTLVTGPFVSDGEWHFLTVVHQPAAVDGLRRKFYLDGRLIASSTLMTGITLGGPAKFVIGSSLSSSNNFIGQIDTVFVTDYSLGLSDINTLYTKTLHDHLPSPKNAGDHIQAMSDEMLLVTFDTLDIEHQVSLKVMS